MTDKPFIQETYGQRFQYCWGCGLKNTEGLHLKSYPSNDGLICLAELSPPPEFTGGVPDKLFGGLIATLFDCHGTASAAWFAHRDKGCELSKDEEIQRFITARLEVDYKAPTPMDCPLSLKAELEELTDRKAIVRMTLEAAGQLRASAKMVAVKVKDEM